MAEKELLLPPAEQAKKQGKNRKSLVYGNSPYKIDVANDFHGMWVAYEACRFAYEALHGQRITPDVGLLLNKIKNLVQSANNTKHEDEKKLLYTEAAHVIAQWPHVGHLGIRVEVINE